MEIKQYKEEVKRTIIVLPTLKENLLHMSYGVTTEVGELFDIFKKKLAYGKEMDIINYKEELGDLLWYYVNGINFGYEHLNEKEFDEDIKDIYDEIYKAIELRNKYKNDEGSLIGILLDNSRDLYHCLIVRKDKTSAVSLLRTGISVISMVCDLKGFNLGEIMDININKLRVRFPEKFTEEKALNRDLDSDRKGMENVK